MNSVRTILVAALAAGSSFSLAPAAQALPARIWVSVSGSDTAGCGPATTPCRSFQYAHDNIAANGEIDVQDPGGYGQLTITKAISVVNDGVGAATIQAASGNGVTINAPAGAPVYLRGLSIDGAGTGTHGILFNTGGKLTVRDCTVRRFSGVASIYLVPTTATTSFFIYDSRIEDNSAEGLYLLPQVGATSVAFVASGLTIGGNGDVGLDIDSAQSANVKAQVLDSLVTNNGGVGIYIYNNAASTSSISAYVRNVVSTRNGGSGFNFASGSTTATFDNVSTTYNGGFGFNRGGDATTFGYSLGNNVSEFNASGAINGPALTVKPHI